VANFVDKPLFDHKAPLCAKRCQVTATVRYVSLPAAVN